MARSIAYAGPRSVQVYTDGTRAWYAHGDYTGTERGVSKDAADMALEDAGWVAGTWRWDEERGQWKAVVWRESDLPRHRPAERTAEEIRAANMRAFGNPEGRRWTEAEARARMEQVKATGKVTGWEKRL